MRPYSDADKQRALKIFEKSGATAAAKVIGCDKATITRWAKAAGITSNVIPITQAATATARAANAVRVQKAWGDYREAEAFGVGVAASQLRRRALAATEYTIGDTEGKQSVVKVALPARDVKDLAIAYGIFIDKAELLSGRATARIESWAESEVDAELRRIVKEFEDATRD